MESNLQSLIQQFSSSPPASTTAGSSAPSSTSAGSALQQSYQNLLGALGVSGNSSSLGGFLQALSQNLQGMGTSGNVVNTQA